MFPLIDLHELQPTVPSPDRTDGEIELLRTKYNDVKEIGGKVYVTNDWHQDRAYLDGYKFGNSNTCNWTHPQNIHAWELGKLDGEGDREIERESTPLRNDIDNLNIEIKRMEDKIKQIDIQIKTITSSL